MSLHIYPDQDSLASGLAEWIGGNMNLVLRSRKRYSFVLSGGSTPKKLYEILATDYAGKIEWERIDFFWGDERYVPFDDKRNNGKMAYETLLTPLQIPENNIYRMQTGPTPEKAAEQYENLLKRHIGDNSQFSFDFTLLGMGDDGHTLSVFPGSPLLNNQTGWVKNVFNPLDQLQRITLLPQLVNRSANIVFMVAGGKKADTLKDVLKGGFNPARYPSQLIRTDGNLMWFVDEDAAQGLLSL